MEKQPITDARYDSLADFLESLVKARVPSNQPVLDRYAREGERDADWYGAGCNTGNDVQRLTRDGWKEGRERMETLRDSIKTVELTPRDRRRKLKWTDSGDTLNIHAVWAGRLETAWRKPVRQTMYGPQRIDLVANMIASGYEHPDLLFYRGAAAAMLTDMLEQAGYMCRLAVVFGGSVAETGEKVSCRVTVKDHGMPLDISAASATILPGFFRALGHGWVAGHSAKRCGSPSMFVGQGIVEPHEILLSHNVIDHGSAVDFINTTLEKINTNTLEPAA